MCSIYSLVINMDERFYSALLKQDVKRQVFIPDVVFSSL